MKLRLFCLIIYIPFNNFSVKSGGGLPGLNQYYARFNVFCSRTQYNDAGKAQPHNSWSRVKSSTSESLCFPKHETNGLLG